MLRAARQEAGGVAFRAALGATATRAKPNAAAARPSAFRAVVAGALRGRPTVGARLVLATLDGGSPHARACALRRSTEAPLESGSAVGFAPCIAKPELWEERPALVGAAFVVSATPCSTRVALALSPLPRWQPHVRRLRLRPSLQIYHALNTRASFQSPRAAAAAAQLPRPAFTAARVLRAHCGPV